MFIAQKQIFFLPPYFQSSILRIGTFNWLSEKTVCGGHVKMQQQKPVEQKAVSPATVLSQVLLLYPLGEAARLERETGFPRHSLRKQIQYKSAGCISAIFLGSIKSCQLKSIGGFSFKKQNKIWGFFLFYFLIPHSVPYVIYIFKISRSFGLHNCCSCKNFRYLKEIIERRRQLDHSSVRAEHKMI